MRNFLTLLNLNLFKVMTGKDLCRDIFINKVADCNPATIFKLVSDTGTLL